jgi:hypothetical protein
MAKAITLSGVDQAANVPSRHRVCTPTEAWSPTLERAVMVCREDMPPASSSSAVMPSTVIGPPLPMRRRGRPKGSKPGARDKKGRPIAAPKFPTCSRYEWVQTKKGPRCKCTRGQGKYAPSANCNGQNKAG